MLIAHQAIACRMTKLPLTATVLTPVSGEIAVKEDIKVVRSHVERRAALMSLTDATDGSRVLVSPAHVEKLLDRPEPSPAA
jgi:hypothetical protein